MIVIRCPYCHEDRTEEELRFGGEAEIVRPNPPEEASDAAWTEYLYFRNNPKGLHQEHWCCATGCGQWFKVARDTVSHDVLEVVPFDHELTQGVVG
jgi:sarcosine oxidase subunit delta